MIFANPIFLWGLLALLIPIAVHLFNFRRYRKVYFSNVERLSAVRSETRRTSTLRRWLVLLMRCLAIVGLVLAFAQPTLPGSEQLQSGTTVVSVYVDNSFSMENSGSNGSQLETAKLKAREIAAAYRPGDRFQLLSNTFAGEEFRWLSREEFLDAVDALQISPASRHLSEVAQRQTDFLNQSGAANRHAYLVSDFQSSIAKLSTFHFPLSTFNFTLVPLEGTATDNLYIDTLVLDAPAYFVSGSVTVEATLRNDGSRDVEKLPVKLFVNGRERALATVDIPAATTAKTSLRFTIDSAGWLNGRVEIADYPVTFDDNYYFTLLAGQRIGMLQVGADNENLEKLFAHDSAVLYRTVSANGLAVTPDLTFILLNELSSLPSGQAQSLATWVEEGGTLCVVPPADGHVEQLNALLAQLNAPRLESWNVRAVRASKVDRQSSLYRQVFSQSAKEEMEMPTVQGRYLMNSGQSLSQPVITLADGSLLLASTPHGAGRLYLFSTPLTAQWTDFVAQALFVPTLYNMALYSRPLPPAAYTLGGSGPIFLQHAYDPAGTPPEMVEVSGSKSQVSSFLPDIRRVGNRSALIPHGELTEAGHYKLGDEYLAFNYDRLESQLQFLTPQEIADAVDGMEGVNVVRNAAKPLDREIRARRNGTPLWHWCILLALAALLAETLLLKVPKVLKDLKDPKDFNDPKA